MDKVISKPLIDYTRMESKGRKTKSNISRLSWMKRRRILPLSQIGIKLRRLMPSLFQKGLQKGLINTSKISMIGIKRWDNKLIKQQIKVKDHLNKAQVYKIKNRDIQTNRILHETIMLQVQVKLKLVVACSSKL